jgi:hypothetical protein
LLSLWPDTELRSLVQARAQVLATDSGPAALAAIDTTCPALDDIATVGLVDAATATEIRVECAVLYSAAGRTAEAYRSR